MLNSIPFFFQKHSKIIVFGLWAILTFQLISHGSYGLEEGAAKAMLLDWSISDEVASSVLTMGIPDLRAIVWLPLAYLFSGQILAVKVFTLGLMAYTAWLLYGWLFQNKQEEAALVSTGLLLIAPLTIEQIDSLSIGIYLLASFAIGHKLHTLYHEQTKGFNGFYFAQMGLCAFAVSLHPAGLAYPASLFWEWHKKPLHTSQQRYFLIGIPLSVTLVLLLTLGWSDLHFWQNPIHSALKVLWGTPLEAGLSSEGWILGTILLAMSIASGVLARKILTQTLLGSALLYGCLIGLLAADQAWAFLILTLLLFAGIPILLRPYPALLKHGFWIQRGWFWVLLLAICTLFMRGDRFHYYLTQNQALSAQDQLIDTFSEQLNALRQEKEANEKPMPSIRVASQWPARTMIACRCDVLPLPPATPNPEAQLALLKNIQFLILAPADLSNLHLASNLAQLNNDIATQSLQAGGVILAIKQTQP